jgi:hypothetical protein
MPSPYTLIGGAVVAAAGLYMLSRDRRAARLELPA